MREKTYFLYCESCFYDNFKKVHAEANMTEDNRVEESRNPKDDSTKVVG